MTQGGERESERVSVTNSMRAKAESGLAIELDAESEGGVAYTLRAFASRVNADAIAPSLVAAAISRCVRSMRRGERAAFRLDPTRCFGPAAGRGGYGGRSDGAATARLVLVVELRGWEAQDELVEVRVEPM